MLKIGITSSLFFFGVVLALLSVLNLNIFGFAVPFSEVFAKTPGEVEESTAPSVKEVASVVGANPNDNAENGSGTGKAEESAGKNKAFEPTVETVYSVNTSPSERIEILSKALGSGSLKALQYLRPEFLNTVPDYRSELLPVLKRRADESLLKRFSEEDWKGWLNSGTVLGGKPTAAFMYGTDVYLVNRELGRFVFTSGYLFHRAWAQASAGKQFNPADELARLTQDNARIHREVATGISWSDLIDPAAAIDPIVLGFLDTIRFRLIERALNPSSNNDIRAVSLLLSLPDAPLPDSTVKAVGAFIRRISAADDHSIRDSLVSSEHESSSLSQLAAHHSQLKTPIAYLLLAVALDLHERGERSDASTVAHFAREFDPAVLTAEELDLFTGIRPAAAKPASAGVAPAAAPGDQPIEKSADILAEPQAGGSAPHRISRIELGRPSESRDDSDSPPVMAETKAEAVQSGAAPARQGLKLDLGPPRSTGGSTEDGPTVPFGMIILGCLLLAGLVFGIRYLIKRFQDRFGEAEFTDLSKNQANADFTLGEGIDVLHQGNRPQR